LNKSSINSAATQKISKRQYATAAGLTFQRKNGIMNQTKNSVTPAGWAMTAYWTLSVQRKNHRKT